jgi:probable blue pigment (indigoidine) exporter
MAASPVAMMAFAWLVLAQPPRARQLGAAFLGIAGVVLTLFTGVVAADPRGVLASGTAMVLSSFGYVLAKRWSAGVDVLSLTAWQLVAGGLVLAPVAVVVEGAPPALDGPALGGFAYVAVVATALAFAAWFTGLRHLDPGTVGLVGLLNPVTGVLLGTAVAGEALSGRQLLGIALVLTGVLLGVPRRRRNPSDRAPDRAPALVLQDALGADRHVRAELALEDPQGLVDAGGDTARRDHVARVDHAGRLDDAALRGQPLLREGVRGARPVLGQAGG